MAQFRIWIFLVFLAGGPLSSAWAVDAASTNQVEEIVARLGGVGTNGLNPRRLFYRFVRSKLTEYLNDKGAVLEREERSYTVHPTGDRVTSDLVSIDRKPAAPVERAEWKRKSHESEARRDLPLNAALLERYRFVLIEDETFRGRPCFVLSFYARPNARGSEGMMDKVLNRLEGKIWVDKEDYQLAKADVHLASRITVLAGVAGALDRMDLLIERTRLEPGLWLTDASHMEIKGRKLFSDFHFRAREDCKDFSLVTGSKANLESVGK